MTRHGIICICDGCDEPAETLSNYPTVVGYCVKHGGVIADWIALVDAPGIVGFDGVRQRWENRLRHIGAL